MTNEQKELSEKIRQEISTIHGSVMMSKLCNLLADLKLENDELRNRIKILESDSAY